MAFSTQKDFLKIAFLNNQLEPVCAKKKGVKLKSYLSSTDSRAWSMNKEKQAHFIADLIACRNYIDKEGGDEEDEEEPIPEKRVKVAVPPVPSHLDQDSLLEMATEKLELLDDMLTQNKNLKNQLAFTHDKVQALEEENKQIKNIVKGVPVPPDAMRPFHKKLEELKKQGKITPNDEKQLLEMQKYLGCEDKDIKLLQAENDGLRTLVEKLAARAKVNKIPPEKEKSTDVPYLQNLVDNLREEVLLLRELEDEHAKGKGDPKKMKESANKMKGDASKAKGDPYKTKSDADKMRGDSDKVRGDPSKMKSDTDKMRGDPDKMGGDPSRMKSDTDKMRGDPDKMGGDPSRMKSDADKMRGDPSSKMKGSAVKIEGSAGKMKGSAGTMEGDDDTHKGGSKRPSNIETIVDERDHLRDQLGKMVGMEDKIAYLKQRSEDADCLELQLNAYKKKYGEINAPVAVIPGMPPPEELAAERDELKKNLAQLEGQLRELGALQEENDALREQIDELNRKLQKMQSLEQELMNTKKRLARSEQALEDYECQLHQLMDVIEDLESQKCFCCCTGVGDNEKDGHIQDLITASKLTLDQIKKEFAERLNLQDQLNESIHEIAVIKERASQEMSNVKDSNKAQINDLMDQLKKCVADNKKLKEKNDELAKNLEDSAKNVKQVRDDIRRSITDLGRTQLPPAQAEAPQPQAAQAVAPQEVAPQEAAPQAAPRQAAAPQAAPRQAGSSESDKCCEEAKQLREDLAKEKTLWENKLKDMTALYEKAKDDCNKSQQNSDQAGAVADELKKQKEESDKEVKALNDVLNEQKGLLASAKSELEKYRNDLTKSNERAAALQSEIDGLKNGNAELQKQLKNKDNELSALNSKVNDLAAQLAACQDKLKASVASEANLKIQMENLNKSINDCNAEMKRMKDEKGGIDSAIAAKENEIKAAMGNLDKCKADLEALRKQLQDKINSLTAEKAALEKEAAANKDKLAQLGKLVSDIEAERAKNKKLEGMVNDFENKLKAAPKELPKGDDGQLKAAMDQMKNQLQNETNKVNDLAAQLAKCQKELADKTAKAASDAAKANDLAAQLEKLNKDLVAKAASGDPLQNMLASQAARIKDLEAQLANCKQLLPAADLDKAASLTKMQSIHDKEKEDISMNYDAEIKALKVANKALRLSLTNLKNNMGAGGAGFDMGKLMEALEELKKGACKCGQKRKNLTRLEKICEKILDIGMDCLDIKELTYLHSEVYKAGLKLKPELVASDNKNRCCKCTGFSCCLPYIPKNKEMKLINRISSLEQEVESASKLLQHLKDSSKRKTPRASMSEKFNAYRVNDEINEFLKRAKDGKTDALEFFKKGRKPSQSK